MTPFIFSDLEFALYPVVEGVVWSAPAWRGGCERRVNMAREIATGGAPGRLGDPDGLPGFGRETHSFRMESVWAVESVSGVITSPTFGRDTEYVLVMRWQAAEDRRWVKRTYRRAKWRTHQLEAAADGDGASLVFSQGMTLEAAGLFEWPGSGEVPDLLPEWWGEVRMVSASGGALLYRKRLGSGGELVPVVSVAGWSVTAGANVVFTAATVAATLNGTTGRLVVGGLTLGTTRALALPRLECWAGGRRYATWLASGGALWLYAPQATEVTPQTGGWDAMWFEAASGAKLILGPDGLVVGEVEVP